MFISSCRTKKKQHLGVQTISQDCVGVADHVLTDISPSGAPTEAKFTALDAAAGKLKI